MQRNFYGVLRVRSITIGDPPQEALSLSHGITTHGTQYILPARRKLPTSYYGLGSGIGITIRNYPNAVTQNPAPKGLKVGVVGLGAGTLAAYGKSGDIYRFYEINPDMIDLAMGKHELFSYLNDSKGRIEIVPGDARISLEREINNGQIQNFDILAVDAFSGDSIPVHLLTREAFKIYLQHLKPGGVLAFHISNRYLDLEALVAALGERYGLEQALIASPGNNAGSYAAVWVLLSKNRSFFQLPEVKDNAESIPETQGETRVWTDDYSNLLPYLRMDVFLRVR